MKFFEWIEEKDKAIDKFLAKKLGVAFSIFDAISPGTTRQVTEDARLLAHDDSFLSRTFFPRKRYDFSHKYGWDALALRFFLGENKHEVFELLDTPRDVTWTGGGDTDSKDFYQDNLSHWNYAWRENYRCGHGVQAGLVNLAAILNPFSAWRAFDNTFSHNGLRLIAYAKNLENKPYQKYFSYLGGGVLCAVGSILGAPRRLAEFVISPVKPLWDCWAYNIENKAIGKSTSKAGWAIATFFSALNIVLLFGLVTALAIPFVTNAANKVVETLGITTAINFIPDKVIMPAATEVTDLFKLNIENLANGDPNNTVSAFAVATTAAMTLPGNIATSVPCLNNYSTLHQRKLDKEASKTSAELGPYPDYWAPVHNQISI